MSGPVVVPPRGGEVVGDPHRRVEILSATPGLHATWSRYGSRTRGAELHAGTPARLPAMVAHGFHNPPHADATYLNLHAPGRGSTEFLRTGDISV